MWVVSLFALSVMVAPAEVPAAPSDVRLAQSDDFGDPPPPPPPALEDELDDAPPPPPLPTTPQRERQRKQERSPQAAGPADDEEPGVFDQYFPFTLSDDLHPAVDDILWSFWVANLIPCVPFPQIWLPLVVLDGDMPDNYLVDAIIVYASHLAPHFAVSVLNIGALFVSAALSFIPIIGIPCALANAGCAIANCLTILPNIWWLMPVAFANNLSRDLKLEEGGVVDANEWLERRREVDLAMAY